MAGFVRGHSPPLVEGGGKPRPRRRACKVAKGHLASEFRSQPVIHENPPPSPLGDNKSQLVMRAGNRVGNQSLTSPFYRGPGLMNLK